MKSYKIKTVLVVNAILLIVLFLGVGCKKTYFRIREESQDKQTVKFTMRESYFELGKSIALTQGNFEIRPGDSTILYVAGDASLPGFGEEGVATLEFKETARFYFMLPTFLKTGSYNVNFRSICEVLGSPQYGFGENLFTCQNGRVVIDSIKGSKIFGQFGGKYINTRDVTLTVEGDFHAKQK